MGDADGVLGPGRQGTGDERCEEISPPSLLTYPTRHRTLDLPLYCMYVYSLGRRSSPVTCTSAIPMWKRRQSGPSCECRQMSSEHDGGFMVTRGGIWKQEDTRLVTSSHFSQLSPPSQAIVSPLGPRIMSLGVLKAARTLTGSSHRSADPHG